MHGLLADLLHAARVYRKTPIASASAVLALGVALGVLAAFLALWSDLALKAPAGFERAGELVTVSHTDWREVIGLTPALIERIAEEAASLEAIAGVQGAMQHLDRGGVRKPIQTELVTEHYFPGLRPLVRLGRGFDADDHRRDASPVVILSHAFWQRELGGREEVVGETLRIHGPEWRWRERRLEEQWQDYRIVGVVSAELSGTASHDVQLWLPFEQWSEAYWGTDAGLAERTMSLLALARRASGASAEAIRAELQSRYADVEALDLGPANGRFQVVRGLIRSIEQHRESLRQVRLFLAGSLLLALVATCNTSLFLLSRAPGRRREFAVRMAVGAPRARLARQLATEAANLVALAAAVGLMTSLWFSALFRDLPFLSQTQWMNATPFDWRVLTMLFGAALLVTILISLAPVVGLRVAARHASSRAAAAGTGWGQRLAVGAQLSIAAAVGAAALAFVWSLLETTTQDRGFTATGIHVIGFQPPETLREAPSDDPWWPQLFEREHRRSVIGSLPGVERVAFGTTVPGLDREIARLEALPLSEPAEPFPWSLHYVDENYFALLGATLRHGRYFEATDRYGLIVNETLARRVWGRTDVVDEVLPIGRDGGYLDARFQILGVVRDLAYGHPSEAPQPLGFLFTGGFAAREWPLVSSTLSATELHDLLQRRIDAGELDTRIERIDRIDDLLARHVAPDRARTWLTAASASLVMLLAAFGFYGLQHYAVAAGRREYAIRAAVGAGPRALGRLVARRALVMGTPGIAFGTILAYLVVVSLQGDFVSSGVSPSVIALLVLAAMTGLLLASSAGPARRARRTAPAPLLREE
jgi:putative ABC transport system permease protein